MQPPTRRPPAREQQLARLDLLGELRELPPAEPRRPLMDAARPERGAGRFEQLDEGRQVSGSAARDLGLAHARAGAEVRAKRFMGLTGRALRSTV